MRGKCWSWVHEIIQQQQQKIWYMTSVTDVVTSVTDVVSTERAINYQLRYLVYFDNHSNSKSKIAITDFASYHG